MAEIRADNYNREKYIVTNPSNRILTIADLNIPSISPGQAVDLLLYTTQQKISQSKSLSTLFDRGWLTYIRQKDTARKEFLTGDAAKTGVVLTKDDQLKYTSSESSTTITAGDEDVIFANATGGDITVLLPEASENEGTSFYVKKTDASANEVIIDGTDAETIDGNLTVSITTQYECLKIFCDGTNWWII